MSVGTRAQIVALLRRGQCTVDELAAAVGTTDNSVRSHLTALERDGVARVEGARRNPGAGKPAVLYGLNPSAEVALSNAYPPTLVALVEVLLESLPRGEAEALLREVGHRLARAVGGSAGSEKTPRVQAAVRALNALGGDVEVETTSSEMIIRGFGCPLASAVSSRPEVCSAVETLVADLTGAPAKQECEHGDRPRCRFRIGNEAS